MKTKSTCLIIIKTNKHKKLRKYFLLILTVAFTYSMEAQINYTGNGIYTNVKTGATGFAKYNTLAKKAKSEIDIKRTFYLINKTD